MKRSEEREVLYRSCSIRDRLRSHRREQCQIVLIELRYVHGIARLQGAVPSAEIFLCYARIHARIIKEDAEKKKYFVESV